MTALSGALRRVGLVAGATLVLAALWWAFLVAARISPFIGKSPLDVWTLLVTGPDAASMRELIGGNLLVTLGDTVVGYLTAAFVVLGPELTYEREWMGEDSAVLQFRTQLSSPDGKSIQVHGGDIITWDEAGQIVDFTVMIRPVKALNAVIEHMSAELLRMLEAAGG